MSNDDPYQGLEGGHITTFECHRCNCTSDQVFVRPNTEQRREAETQNLLTIVEREEIAKSQLAAIHRLESIIKKYNESAFNRFWYSYTILDDGYYTFIRRKSILGTTSPERDDTRQRSGRVVYPLPPTHYIACPVCGNKHSFNVEEEAE